MAVRSEAMEARRSALDVLQRALSTPTRSPRKIVSLVSPNDSSGMLPNLPNIASQGGNDSNATPSSRDVVDQEATHASSALVPTSPSSLSDHPHDSQNGDQENVTRLLPGSQPRQKSKFLRWLWKGRKTHGNSGSPTPLEGANIERRRIKKHRTGWRLGRDWNAQSESNITISTRSAG